MSCGVCPGDLQDRGMAVIGRNFYSGSSRQTYMCVPQAIRQYAMSSQTNAASQYGKGATNMQPRSQYQSQVRQHATSYVSDQYARPISLPVYQIMFSGGAKLEDRIESPRGLEEKVGTEMYSSQRILNASRNFDEIQDRARETMGKVLSLAAKREALEREIKESLEIAEAA